MSKLAAAVGVVDGLKNISTFSRDIHEMLDVNRSCAISIQNGTTHKLKNARSYQKNGVIANNPKDLSSQQSMILGVRKSQGALYGAYGMLQYEIETTLPGYYYFLLIYDVPYDQSGYDNKFNAMIVKANKDTNFCNSSQLKSYYNTAYKAADPNDQCREEHFGMHFRIDMTNPGQAEMDVILSGTLR